MSAFRLAFALLCIPRLFVSLVLFPLILSLCLVYAQLVVTALFFEGPDRLRSSNDDIRTQRIMERGNNNFARKIIYGSETKLGFLQVCRWVIDPSGVEVPPRPECAPDRLDVAIQTEDPENFDVKPYRSLFERNIERLHVCRTCHPDVIIKNPGGETTSEVYSVWGLMVLSMVDYNRDLNSRYVEVFRELNRIKTTLGEVKLHIPGLQRAVNISSLTTSFAVVFNLAFIIVVTMWLALRAHRRVLDYFARSGALLPMVAASGKLNFYGAIWILTFTRVGAFLIASVPLLYWGFSDNMRGALESIFDPREIWGSLLWLLAITLGLSLATLIASIAELKHRHSLIGFSYRYLPFALAGMGVLIWSVTFLFEGATPMALRTITTTMPILGLGPMLMAPVFEPKLYVFGWHAVLTLGLFIAAVKFNSRWFAAHLEEL